MPSDERDQGAVETGLDSSDERTDTPAGATRLKQAVLVIIAFSSFMVVLDTASLPIPLPSMLHDLGGTLDAITWVFGAFVLAFAISLLPFARLADTYDRRRLFLSGGMVFASGSLVAALAPSMSYLIGALAIQGIGAAMLEPAARALIRATFPPEQHRVAFGMQRASVFAGAALGPILSGYITTVFSWRYVFWLNLLLAATVVAGAVLMLPASRASQTGRRFDLTGLLLGASGLFFLMFPLIEGARLGWRSPAVVGSFVLSSILLALFIVTERQVREPLVPLTLFHDRLFAVGNMLRGVTEFVSLGVFFALSHFLQVQLGYSALVTGLLLMAIIGGALVSSPIAEALAGRVDVRWLVIPGFVLVAIGTFWVAHVSPRTGWGFFIAPLAVAGAGFGALESPTTSAMQQNITPAQEEAAWRVSYTVYLLGIGLGVAVVSAVWQSQLVGYVHETLSRGSLPLAMVNRFVSSLLAGGRSGSGTVHIEALIQQAFAHAINAALLSCVAMAVLGAIVALFFSSRQVHVNNDTNVHTGGADH